MRRGLTKVAVYRDGRGTAHERSAVCPHLGCIVHWNGAEKTWDCPCHGSRFEPKGEVIAGPANTPLANACAGRETFDSWARRSLGHIDWRPSHARP
jgi:Rieske Fe-S protein